jgi:putative hydrolase of HD superfamily
MTMCPPPSLSLDLPKCMTMCLIHDMAESLVGDITPADGIPKEEKNRRESLTMEYVTRELLGAFPDVGETIRATWQEYEDCETLESRFVQDLDKVELLLQMVEYEKRGRGHVDLSEFTYVATKISLPETKAWADEILEERKEFWNGITLGASVDGGDALQMKKMQDQYYDGA